MADLTRHMRADMNPDYYWGFCEFVEVSVPENAVVAEIGVYAGESTRIMMETGRVAELWAVDFWQDDYSPLDHWARVYPMKDVRQAFFDNMQEFFPKVKVFVAESLWVAQLAPDHYFDVVYIDANHEEPHPENDIKAWKSKVKPGGVLSGHDYHPSWPPVVRAVDTLLGGPAVLYADSTWVKFL